MTRNGSIGGLILVGVAAIAPLAFYLSLIGEPKAEKYGHLDVYNKAVASRQESSNRSRLEQRAEVERDSEIDWSTGEIKNQTRTISQRGLSLIQRYEGFSSTVYRCPAGRRTIGYGHMLTPGENFTRMSQEEAQNLLRQDVQSAENVIQRYVTVKLTQGQYDALCSFIYNLGEGNFRNSTLLRRINAGNFDEAANEFSRWIKANGLVLKGLQTRRAEERNLFLN